MRVGIVGGLARSEPHYSRLARAAGHEAVFHEGHVNGRQMRMLEQLLDRCDLVIIVTDVNSHGAVQLARRRLKERGRTPLLLRRCSPARFAQLLAALEVREERDQRSFAERAVALGLAS
jgi:hypothetical protein